MPERIYTPIGQNGLEHFIDIGTNLRLYICSDEPSTIAQATSTYALGNISNPYHSSVAASTAGRKITFGPLSGGTVTANGTATYYAITEGTTELLARGSIGNAGGLEVSVGGSFSLAAFDIDIPHGLSADVWVADIVIDKGIDYVHDYIDSNYTNFIYVVLTATEPDPTSDTPSPESDNTGMLSLTTPGTAVGRYGMQLLLDGNGYCNDPGTMEYAYIYHGGASGMGFLGWTTLTTPTTVAAGDSFSFSDPLTLSYLLTP